MGPPWTNCTHCSSYSQQAAFSNRRQFTINLPLNETREYSRWLRGANYNVANILSQDNNRTEDKLTQIQNCSAAKRDRLMVILASATAARQVTVGANTLDSKTWAWNHYSGYCWSRDNLRQPFPQRHVPNSPHWNHGRFRRGCASRAIFLTTWCSPGWKHSLRNTLNHMAAVFRENGHDNPKRDTEHNVAGLLRHQQRSFKKDNPNKKLFTFGYSDLSFPQNPKTLPSNGELAGVAHFWVMRSCEYAKVPETEQSQTKMKQQCIRNIAFIWDGETPDCIFDHFRTTEKRQKGRHCHSVVVIRWASVHRQNLGINNKENSVVQGANKNSSVSLVKHKNMILNVTAGMIADLCRDGC